ncbi:hybrid sensor histidine kinase/response regulator [Spirilliplanes yamanashiensis]|uniref:histidine kinase n=1 Tax=Spirilliplanes yamanashiensis TaxID=42233 RepID=A0A8J3YBN3_9ACTN|nr:response regulator [Spirilliplanes yamanashiensis]MDP9818023.1 two-component system chemotaxis sensor kinase CheA [Spirilliplanes yamanashiensis]GIJ04832.1 transcriptional regulator [Spirilliplanes yamanashiensis]
MTSDPLRYFRIEARELADGLSQAALDLERGPDPDVVGRMLRLAHTLKGAARVVRQPALAEQAHALEDVLVEHRETGGPLPAADAGRMLDLTDAIAAGVAALEAPAGPPPAAPPAAPPARPPAPPSAPSAPPPAPPPGTWGGTATAVRTAPVVATVAAPVSAHPGPDPARETAPDPVGDPAAGRGAGSDVDELLDAVGEAHARFAPLHAQAATLHRLRRAADSLADQLRGDAELIRSGPARTAGVRGSEAVRAAAVKLAGELAVLGRRMTDSVEQVERELDDVRGRAERLRLVAAASIFTGLHRAVRDAARAQGKRVTFTAGGGDLRIDPQMLAQASSALLHVVRNAVAHGIEGEAGRAAAGKPAEGSIAVQVARRERFAVFTVTDDGRGFDLDGVRRAAVARGQLAPDAVPTGEELVQLVLRGGISTAEGLTEVAGRGIGLDVVRDMAEQVGGSVAVRTTPGAGSVVELAVPLTLVSLHGLVVEAGGSVATVPLDQVRSCLRLDAAQAAAVLAAGRLAHEGEALPYLPLSRVLTDAGPPDPGRAVVVVMAAETGRVAVGVDRLLGTSTMVVRPLPELAPADPVVGGLSLDVEGNPRPVLDPRGLLQAALGPAPAAPSAEPAQHLPILVVDDSLTTRMLERSILESAGYEVDLAASAEEALDKARRRRYALFLSDIDMPGMSGFQFVEQTRADPELADVPAILVSSRSSAADRQRGLDAGAGAYVVKGEFDQEELLRHIRKLVPA